VDTACAKALEAEAINVGLIGRMLERATEDQPAVLPRQGTLLPGRFARSAAEFATAASNQPHSGIDPGADRAAAASVEDGFEPECAVDADGGRRRRPPSRVTSRPCCGRSSWAAVSTPCPSAWPWPRAATWLMPSSWSWCWPTRSPAGRPPRPPCGPKRLGWIRI
jgi:hypothetical protein